MQADPRKEDSEVRRLLYNAAMQGRHSSLPAAQYYLRLRERGMSSTAALVGLRRKLAKVSIALRQSETQFVPTVCNTA